MTPPSEAGEEIPPLGWACKLWYGVGQAAEGMKNAAFGTFLLLFYSQILGLPAWLAGLALAIALAVDAVTDPVVGSISDTFRHRWGRRHPFLYASALPLGIAFALSFRPPAGIGTAALFAWMLGFTMLARLAMTLYHVPHLALGAELTEDYHERTSVVAWRNFFGLIGAAALLIACREIFLAPTPEFPNGELDPAGYPRMAVAAGAAMAGVIFVSALGTHHRIPYLHAPSDAGRSFSGSRLSAEMREALSHTSFRYLFLGILVFFVAQGVANALGIYMGTYFWRLRTEDLLLIPVCSLLGLATGTPFWAVVSRRFGLDKGLVFVGGVTWAAALGFVVPVAKIVGFFPPHDHPAYLAILYAAVLLGAAGASGAMVSAGSMLADVADEHELATGRRQEGMFFGALSFAGKSAVGIGGALAGAALSAISFPTQAVPGEVPEGTVLRLALVAGPGVSVVSAIGIALMSRYGLSRERALVVQRALHERRGAR